MEHIKDRNITVIQSATSDKPAKPVLWDAKELQTIMGGRWAGKAPQDVYITGVNYYERQVEPGDLVFTTEPKTWRSPNYKNTNHIISALFDKKKAAMVVAGELAEDFITTDKPVLLVEDTRKALDALGKAARARLSGVVVAVTGSAGKTTTKEMIRYLLSLQDTTKGSRKNYNHGPGISLMLAETPPETRYCVYEFSVDLPYVTEKKADIVRPNIAMITNIHSDHLQFYGTLENLTDQKCLLFKYLVPDGIALLNHDSTLFERQLANAQAAGVKKIITFGLHKDADLRAVSSITTPESSDVKVFFQGQLVSFHVNQPGMHIVMDCLGALAVVHAAGGDWKKAAGDIEKAPVLGRRNEQYEISLPSGNITLIDDTFSANPASMQAGLAVLGLTSPGRDGRRIAVMSEIKELGETSADLHTALAPHVIDARVDVLYTIGRDLEGLWKSLPETMQGEHSEDPEHIAKAIIAEMRGGDIVWIKGSRRSTANLEMILSAVKKAGKDIRKKRLEEDQENRGHHLHKENPEEYCPVRVIKTLQRPSRLDVMFVGDTAFGENYQVDYENHGEENILKQRGYDAPLAKVRQILLDADLVIANLETPLTDLKVSPLADQKSWVHWGDVKKTPTHLLAHNITAVGLANNHMFDYGETGFFQTLESLKESGIDSFGGGMNIKKAGKAFVLRSEIDGKSFVVATISMYAGPSLEKDTFGIYASEEKRGLNPVSFQHLRKEIERVRKEYPEAFIVVFPHWGPNYGWRTDRQAKTAKKILEAGVDLVIGHGAHMLQEIERHKQGWIIYSIGNFMFNSKGRYGKLGAPPYSLMAKLQIDIQAGNLRKRLQLYPIVTDNRLTDYQTRPVTEKEFEEVVMLLRNHSSSPGDFVKNVRWEKEMGKEGLRFFIELTL